MAFRLFTPFRLHSPLGLSLTFSTAFATKTLLSPSPLQLLHCDSSRGASSSTSDWSYKRTAQTPVFKDGRPNPMAYRQISSGSILGLAAGLAVSTFSKTLALLLGLAVCIVQFAASRGIHIIPYKRLQSYVSGVDLRSTLEDNVAFKISFGLTFALAAFAPM
ncbi:MAG: hypothetical protein M1825_000940 [Sarcosagium campestre]|nr:MAG: hypothetical protein M1825_000940 [Sarcosagium campestre]